MLFHVEPLSHFAHFFDSGNIEGALIYAEPILHVLFHSQHIDALIVHSKGVALATLLVNKGT